MEVVILPLVWPQTPVARALELLKLHRRAGVVRQNPDDTYRLLFAGDLLRARAGGRTQIDQIQGGRAIVLVDVPMAASFNFDLVRPHRTWRQCEQMLDAYGVQYGLVGEGAEEAMLVTRFEQLKDMLSTTGGFECTGIPTHFFPEPSVEVDRDCPLIPECSRADGTRPRIRSA